VMESSNSGMEGYLLVVEYSTGRTDRLYAAVPLTPEGCPNMPFRYAGQKRRPEEIARDLPPAQRMQIDEARFTLHDESWLKRQEANPRFRRLNWTTDGTS